MQESKEKEKRYRIVEGETKTFHFEIRMDEDYLYYLWSVTIIGTIHVPAYVCTLWLRQRPTMPRARPPISAILAGTIEYCPMKLYSIRGCFQLRHNDRYHTARTKNFHSVQFQMRVSIRGECYTYKNNNNNDDRSTIQI